MKKVLSVVIALIIVVTIFSVYGNNKASAEKFEPLKVGFLYIGAANDGGFTQAQDESRQAVQKYFKGKVETAYTEDVGDQPQDVKYAAEQLIKEGCKVIVATSYSQTHTVKKLAEKYKNIYFISFSGRIKNGRNLSSVFGSIDQPRYLSGIAAGKMTKSNKIGYVAAYNNKEILIGINAFTLGVKSVNKDAEVEVVFINNWYDPAAEHAAATDLIDNGCDVLTQHSDTTGAIEAVKDAKDVYFIGYNVNKADEIPKRVITSVVWHHEVYYIKAVNDILQNNFKSEKYYGTMSDGYVDLEPLGNFVPERVKAAVKKAKRKMISGDLCPFSGKIKYADGTYLCRDGEKLSNKEIWGIDKVIDGVKITNK